MATVPFSDRTQNLKRAEDALAEHDRTCKVCQFASKRDSCPTRYNLEQAAIRAFKGQ